MDDLPAALLNEVMTAGELAEFLQIHISTVHRLAQMEGIPAFKVGGLWRFHLKAIESWITESR